MQRHRHEECHRRAHQVSHDPPERKQRLLVEAMRVIHEHDHRLLVRHRLHHFREGTPRRTGRRRAAELRQRGRWSPGDPWSIEQPAARDPEHPAPWVALVGCDCAHSRDHCAVEPSPGREFFGEPGLPGAGVALDDDDRRLPLGPARRPRVRQSSELERAPHQWGATRR